MFNVGIIGLYGDEPLRVPGQVAIPSISLVRYDSPGGTVRVTWSAPPDLGNPPATHYDLSFNASTVHATVNASTTTWTGSRNDGTHRVNVRARNTTGAGQWSPSSSQLTIAPPPFRISSGSSVQSVATPRSTEPKPAKLVQVNCTISFSGGVGPYYMSGATRVSGSSIVQVEYPDGLGPTNSNLRLRFYAMVPAGTDAEATFSFTGTDSAGASKSHSVWTALRHYITG